MKLGHDERQTYKLRVIHLRNQVHMREMGIALAPVESDGYIKIRVEAPPFSWWCMTGAHSGGDDPSAGSLRSDGRPSEVVGCPGLKRGVS